MDIQQILTHYRRHIERLPKASTRNDYTKRLTMLERFASMNGITAVENLDFVAFLDWVYIERGVSPRTHNNYRTWCHSFCRWLRLQHYIAGDPLLDVPPLKEPPKVRQPLPPSELKRVRDYLYEHNKHFLLAVMLEYYTFIRPDELSNIRIGDIDTKSHAIYVRAEISKNGKAEMVGLNNAALSLMRELHVLRSPKDWYLFSVRCRPGATKLHSRMFRDRWARLRKHLGLPKEYQFYSLKDSGIRDLANSEGIVIARDQARHSSVAVTNKYLQGRDRPVHKETIRFKGAL